MGQKEGKRGKRAGRSMQFVVRLSANWETWNSGGWGARGQTVRGTNSAAARVSPVQRSSPAQLGQGAARRDLGRVGRQIPHSALAKQAYVLLFAGFNPTMVQRPVIPLFSDGSWWTVASCASAFIPLRQISHSHLQNIFNVRLACIPPIFNRSLPPPCRFVQLVELSACLLVCLSA